jgi:hypothetical protein
MSKHGHARSTNVVNLALAREERRRQGYQGTLSRILASNRCALERLFASGALFSTEGARVGRDLLRAHEHLLEVAALLEHLADEGVLPAPRGAERTEAVYARLDTLLVRTSTLTRRTSNYLAHLSTP